MAWCRIGNLAAISLALVFTACGGDSGNNGKSDTEELSQAETFDDLPNCSKNREGETQTVVSERKTYQCVDGRWKEHGDILDSVKTEDDLPACLEKNEGKIAFVSKDTTAWGCFDSRWDDLGKAYESADDLPNCSEKRGGSVAYITDEGKQLFCSNGKWTTEKIDSLDQGGESKSEVKSSSSNKTSSSSGTGKEFDKSSSSESRETSSGGTSSSFENTQSSSSTLSSNSVEPKVSSGTLTDERDGQKYKTVQIGELVWMAQNLNYDDGYAICPMNKDDNCEKYGRLYHFHPQDSFSIASLVCPVGWHVPDKFELYELLEYVFQNNGGEPMGVSLKSVSGWPLKGTKIIAGDSIRVAAEKGTDQFGFSAIPAGVCWGNDNPNECYIDDDTRFYIKPDFRSSDDYVLKLAFDKDHIQWDDASSISWGGYVSVRCVQDNSLKKDSTKIDFSKFDPIEIDSMPHVARIDAYEVMIEDLSINGKTNVASKYVNRVCPNEWQLINEQQLKTYFVLGELSSYLQSATYFVGENKTCSVRESTITCGGSARVGKVRCIRHVE